MYYGHNRTKCNRFCDLNKKVFMYKLQINFYEEKWGKYNLQRVNFLQFEQLKKKIFEEN